MGAARRGGTEETRERLTGGVVALRGGEGAGGQSGGHSHKAEEPTRPVGSAAACLANNSPRQHAAIQNK